MDFSNFSMELLSAMSTKTAVQNVLDLGTKYLNQPLFLYDITGKAYAKSTDHAYPTNLSHCSFFPIKTGKNHLLLLASTHSLDHFDEKSHDILIAISQTLALVCHGPHYTLCQTAPELLLYHLLEQPQKSRQELNERLKFSHFPTADSYQLMILCNSQNLSHDPIFDIAKQYLKSLLPSPVMVEHNHRLVILYTKISIEHPFSKKKYLCDFLKKYHLTASVSLPFSHPQQIHQAYIQTLQALDEGLALDHNEHLYLYQDYLPYHALSMIKDSSQFCHPCISDLQAYDATYQTDYTHTLYHFIMNFRNMKNTAQQMNIHYNTLKYRMRKLEMLLDFSLDDQEIFLLLYLSFNRLKLDGHIF